ncbi:hypothetical protein LZ30DRAFT_422181 [Colletotrichum cereale]|nr:hypothetical protein LZ30DRAFT_422181 [Colletotrichum cereale]
MSTEFILTKTWMMIGSRSLLLTAISSGDYSVTKPNPSLLWDQGPNPDSLPQPLFVSTNGEYLVSVPMVNDNDSSFFTDIRVGACKCIYENGWQALFRIMFPHKISRRLIPSVAREHIKPGNQQQFNYHNEDLGWPMHRLGRPIALCSGPMST